MSSTLSEHYDPERVEQHVKRYWSDVDAYERSKEANADGEPFFFVDGPPNTSGRMHCGTAWGKVLKDAFLRYYRMRGRDVVARPGYDTHGLPVERRVEAELGVESKQDIEEYGVEQFVADCRAFVGDNRASMDDEFADLGVWMDWDDPYQTMDTEYMEVVWTAFAELYERGLLDREQRIVNTCPNCETSVAETRLNYETREATAAYVGFPLEDHDGWLVTWTTTPWTVTANQFVAVDEAATYLAVETPSRRLYVAEECVDDVMQALGVADWTVRDRLPGAALDGWTYRNPLADCLPADAPSQHGVVAPAEYVERDRTGLVHSAPGFGEVDFERGRELGLSAYAPLNESGRFVDAGEFEGLPLDELRDVVLSALDANDALLAHHDHEHDYPRCPRCDTAVLYRAADQWVVQVSTFKSDLLDAVDDTTWYPEEARDNRFRSMVEEAPDWNVSRQRYWGTPVPVWSCEDCGHEVVVGDAEELVELTDLNERPEDLHRPAVDPLSVECPHCGGDASRDPDVLDVWFDSSVASWATERVHPPDLPAHWPADLLVEGHDQTRGWFLMQLYMGVVLGDQAPYEEVLMHGFATLDGRAMSKSTGHVLRPPEVVAEHGRDALRGHLLLHNPTRDVNLDSELSGVETVADNLDVIWNVYRFGLLYMSMDDHAPVMPLETEPEDRAVLDDWVLSRLQATVETVHEEMANRRTDRAFTAVVDFLVEDVSRTYVPGVRDRVWGGSEAAYDALGTVLQAGTRLLAPFTPFLAETLYQELDGDATTVHATFFPTADDSLRDRTLEAQINRVGELEETTATARQRAGRKHRWPVVEVVVETTDETLTEAVRTHRDILKHRLNAKNVLLTRQYDRTVTRPVPRMDELGPAFGQAAPDVAEAIREQRVTEFPATVTVDGTTRTVTGDMVTVNKEAPSSVEAVAFEHGTVYVDTSLTTSVKREGVVRDLLRRAQDLRADLDVEMEEPVVLGVESDTTFVREAIEAFRDELAAEVRADRVQFTVDEMDATTEWAVDEATVSVGVRRLREAKPP